MKQILVLFCALLTTGLAAQNINLNKAVDVVYNIIEDEQGNLVEESYLYWMEDGSTVLVLIPTADSTILKKQQKKEFDYINAKMKEIQRQREQLVEAIDRLDQEILANEKKKEKLIQKAPHLNAEG